MSGKRDGKIEENILNVPNALTLIRIIMAFIIVYLIFAEYKIILIVTLFVIAASTDFFDGQIAKRFNQKTEFGRKFDMIADRILWISVIFALLINFSIRGLLGKTEILQLFLILTREVITLPFYFVGIKFHSSIPDARLIGKTVTFFQGIAIPVFMLSLSYEAFSFSLYLAILTGILGFISGLYYIYDVLVGGRK